MSTKLSSQATRSVRWLTVGDVLDEAAYGTSTKASDTENGVPVLRMGNVRYDGSLDLGDLKYVSLPPKELSKHLLREGDILFNRTNSRDLVGKTGLWDGRFDAVAASYFVRLRVNRRIVMPEYLWLYMNSPGMKRRLFATARGAIGQANINTEELRGLPIPLPPLPEQRRIVDILNRANGIRRLRREAQEKARQVIPALFVKMFGDPSRESPRWPTAPLREVAEIGSGITKGRRLKNLESIELPYLRVANVQDGYLNLEEIRTIDVHPSEVSRFRLEPGDLVMTEGGDPDKLGRAAIWNGEIQDCVHQNHVFRVRCRQAIVLPQYVRELAGSQYGKGYFLRIAKRTTGIATINKTQLGAFPIPVPPLSLQQAFASRVAALQSIIARQDRAALVEERLARSLMARVFEDAC